MDSLSIPSSAVARLLLSVESLARLDVLLYLRDRKGRPSTAKAVASACQISPVAAEQHLAKLCARGLVGVDIGTELHYSYRPFDPRTRVTVDELEVLSTTNREGLAAWLASSRIPHALIVEDDPDMRELIHVFMVSRGFGVTALPHGHASLACAAGDTLAASIIDIRPSSTPGLTLARALRSRPDPVLTVVTTSLGDVRLRSQLTNLGISAVLEKPFDLDELGRVLDTCS